MRRSSSAWAPRPASAARCASASRGAGCTSSPPAARRLAPAPPAARVRARAGARAGLHALAAGRTPARLDALVAGIRGAGGTATAVETDTTLEAHVLRLFDV